MSESQWKAMNRELDTRVSEMPNDARQYALPYRTGFVEGVSWLQGEPVSEADIIARFGSLSNAAINRIMKSGLAVIGGRMEDGVFE